MSFVWRSQTTLMRLMWNSTDVVVEDSEVGWAEPVFIHCFDEQLQNFTKGWVVVPPSIIATSPSQVVVHS
jgi:hypothetical protein